MSRYDLSDFAWRVIEPLLPIKPRGVPRIDDRRVLNGIFWVLRSGAPWRDLPERYGPHTTCYNRFVRWRKAGIWDWPMDAIMAAHDGDIQIIDSTSVRPPAGRGGKKEGVQIIVSIATGAGPRPRSTSSSMRKGSRSGSAWPPVKRMLGRSPTRCSTALTRAPSCWRTRPMMPTASVT